MKIIILLVASFFLAINYGCDREYRHIKTSEEQEMDRADIIADRIISIFSKKMFETKKLVTIGTGGGGPGKLRMLAVDFDCYQKMDISQSRKLLLECVDEFLIEINKTPELKPYSRVFPFTYRNVNISILFVDKKKNDFVDLPAIASIDVDEGSIMYKTYHDEQLDIIKKETYEEALKIVEQESRSS